MGLMGWHVRPPGTIWKVTIPLNPFEPAIVITDCPYEPARISEGETAPADMEKSGTGAITYRGMFSGLVKDPCVPVTLIVYDPGAAVESAVTDNTTVVRESTVMWLKFAVIPEGRFGAMARFTLPVKPLNAFKLTVAAAIPPCCTVMLVGSEPRLKSEGIV